MINPTVYRLFSLFPREVGQFRQPCKNWDDFVKYIQIANGETEVFTSVYDKRFTVDKIVFDIDDKKNVKEAYNVVCKMYRFLKNQYSVIPDITGKKGYHLYLEVENEKNVDPRKLRDITLTLIKQAFGFIPKQFDMHLVGNLRALIRVPNTLRPPGNDTYCSFLPPDFDTMEFFKVLGYSKQPQKFLYEYKKSPPLSSFEIDSDIKYEENSLNITDQLQVSSNKMLEKCIRPCLYRHLTMREPFNDVRVAATIDLLRFFTEQEILNMFRQLSWADFDEEKTAYYISKINQHSEYKQYSCGRLRKLHIPRQCCVD